MTIILINPFIFRDGVKTLNKCRTSLMFAYPFAYYLPASNNKHIFEDNQTDLEHSVEGLSHLLEEELDMEEVDLGKIKQQVCFKDINI